MLLRRVIEHVKAQNWTAVALDFVIVVVGVFIGIQVSNWNGVRAERAQEADILFALREDIRESSQHLAERLGDIDEQMEALQVLAELGESREFDVQMKRDVGRLVLIGIYEQVFVRPRLVVLDELRGSGRLRLIRSDALRHRLQQLDAVVIDLNLLTADLRGLTHLHTDSFLLANIPTRNYVNE
jgi:hypothetical protein